MTMRYGDVTALDDLSLELPGGRIYGLLGRNGSGKTTLLTSMAGFRRAPRGSVWIGGQEPWENATVLEDVCLLGEKVVNADGDRVKALLSRAARYRPRWDAEFANRLLDIFQVSPKHYVGRLSRGQRSAVGITIALAGRTSLTLLDEAYLGMDAPSRYTFYDVLLEDYMAHPRTFVVSTHHIDEVAPLFEAVAIVDKGKVVAYDDTENLRTRRMAVPG